MAHFASILFFSGLLAVLALILELTIRAYRAEIVAALRGVALVTPAPATPRMMPPSRHWRAAA